MSTLIRKPSVAKLVQVGNTQVLWLTRGKLTTAYRLEQIRCEIGGVAFQLSKAHQGGEEEPEVYHVWLNGHDSSCTCAGNSLRGKCKHVDGIRALIRAAALSL